MKTLDTAQHALAGWLNGTNGTAVFCTCGHAFFVRFDEHTDPLEAARGRLEQHRAESQITYCPICGFDTVPHDHQRKVI